MSIGVSRLQTDVLRLFKRVNDTRSNLLRSGFVIGDAVKDGHKRDARYSKAWPSQASSEARVAVKDGHKGDTRYSQAWPSQGASLALNAVLFKGNWGER